MKRGGDLPAVGHKSEVTDVWFSTKKEEDLCQCILKKQQWQKGQFQNLPQAGRTNQLDFSLQIKIGSPADQSMQLD